MPEVYLKRLGDSKISKGLKVPLIKLYCWLKLKKELGAVKFVVSVKCLMSLCSSVESREGSPFVCSIPLFSLGRAEVICS